MKLILLFTEVTGEYFYGSERNRRYLACFLRMFSSAHKKSLCRTAAKGFRLLLCNDCLPSGLWITESVEECIYLSFAVVNLIFIIYVNIRDQKDIALEDDQIVINAV